MQHQEVVPVQEGVSPRPHSAHIGSSIALCPDGELAFTMAAPTESSADETAKIPVTFERVEDSVHWPTVFSSNKFQAWVGMYEKQPSLQLISVAVKYLNIKDGVIKTLIIAPKLNDNSTGEMVEQVEDIVLRQEPNCAGVLVMLRCSFYDESRIAQQSPPSRDFVLYNSAIRPAIGKESNLEILTGNFDESGEFVSSSADELASRLNVRMRKSDLVYLTTAKQKGVVPDPRQVHEFIHLYLFRQNITESQLNSIARANVQKKDAADLGSLRLTTLGEAWKATTDAKSIAALFLFHEFRYHRLMPKYKPPRDAKLTDSMINSEKRKPQFTDINSLRPPLDGINLRVKVARPLGEVTEVNGRDGKTREAVLLVGDATGIVNLRLEGSQLDIPEIHSSGACLTVQNARVEIMNTFLFLHVDKWGKINVNSPDDPDFTFSPNMDNNKSEIEYELVDAENHTPRSFRDTENANNGTQTYSNGRPGRGGRGGGRGRGFGRGRGRGGRN